MDFQVIRESVPLWNYSQAWIVPAILGGISLVGSLLKGKGGTTSKQSGTSDTTSNTSSTTTPNYDPLLKTARDTTLNQYMNLNQEDPNLQGYEAGGIRTINQNSDIKSKVLSNLMASRGLSYSPAGLNPQLMAESSRIGDITNFENTIPLLAEQQRLARLQAMGGFVSGLPVGQTSTGTNTSSTNTTGKGNQSPDWMGAIGGSITDAITAALAAKKAGY